MSAFDPPVSEGGDTAAQNTAAQGGLRGRFNIGKQNVKSDLERFQGMGLNFKGKIIGIEDVEEARGDKMCQDAMFKLKGRVQMSGQHKQRITINVSLDGIKILDERSGSTLHHHAVHKISFISRDVTDARAFGYVYGDAESKHTFFAIKTAQAAEGLVLSLRDLFQVVYDLKKKEIEKAKEAQEDGGEGEKKEEEGKAEEKKESSEEKKEEPASSSGATDNLLGLQDELASLSQGVQQMNVVADSITHSTASNDPWGTSASTTETASAGFESNFNAPAAKNDPFKVEGPPKEQPKAAPANTEGDLFSHDILRKPSIPRSSSRDDLEGLDLSSGGALPSAAFTGLSGPGPSMPAAGFGAPAGGFGMQPPAGGFGGMQQPALGGAMFGQPSAGAALFGGPAPIAGGFGAPAPAPAPADPFGSAAPPAMAASTANPFETLTPTNVAQPTTTEAPAKKDPLAELNPLTGAEKKDKKDFFKAPPGPKISAMIQEKQPPTVDSTDPFGFGAVSDPDSAFPPPASDAGTDPFSSSAPVSAVNSQWQAFGSPGNQPMSSDPWPSASAAGVQPLPGSQPPAQPGPRPPMQGNLFGTGGFGNTAPLM